MHFFFAPMVCACVVQVADVGRHSHFRDETVNNGALSAFPPHIKFLPPFYAMPSILLSKGEKRAT